MPPLTRTPAAWLAALEDRLAAQQRGIRLFDDYYAGRHRMAFATEKFRDTFGDLFRALADNWCKVVVDAPVERMRVEGFRFGEPGDMGSDDDAWRVFEANHLDAFQTMAHTEAVKLGGCALLVAPAPDSDSEPRITIEHPSQMYVAVSRTNRLERLGALKKWREEDDYIHAVLYLPDQIVHWRSQTKVARGAERQQRINWQGVSNEPNPFGEVSAVPMDNAEDLLEGGRSDLETAIPLQDAINKEIADMLIASEYAAFPQRVAIGVDVPKDPTTGLPLPGVELKASLSRFWAFANENAKVAEFRAADLGNYVKAIEVLLHHLSSQTRTPPHYIAGDLVNVSGDGLRMAETGLVARTRGKFLPAGYSWSEAMRLAFKARNDPRGNNRRGRAIWGDPETRSDAERVDAAVKLHTLGVPLEKCWARAGFTQAEIEDMRRMAGLPLRPPPGATTSAVPDRTSAGGVVLPAGARVPVAA